MAALPKRGMSDEGATFWEGRFDFVIFRKLRVRPAARNKLLQGAVAVPASQSWDSYGANWNACNDPGPDGLAGFLNFFLSVGRARTAPAASQFAFSYKTTAFKLFSQWMPQSLSHLRKQPRSSPPSDQNAYIRQARHNPAFQGNILQIFSPEILARGYYTVEIAEAWLEVDKFLRWLGHRAENSAATQPGTPTTPSPSYKPLLASAQLPPSSSPTREMLSSLKPTLLNVILLNIDTNLTRLSMFNQSSRYLGTGNFWYPERFPTMFLCEN
ncbi:hypothetical protein C8R45DRAFT_945952 [Mycena sanguinolenta]|nr:hypothetical protein C8R45DRAFT_945952 [Mycena sanguinolenta]